MCGICGQYASAGTRLEELRRMASTLAHRGPDDEGYYVSGPIGLACRRLSIIDPEGGHQPLANEDRTARIVFNGEIYNYRELRSDLERRGHVFSTRSDTEVILHLYEDSGERCVEKLRGMFAFAIWDEKKEKLFLARDRLGQKPLFYAQRDGRFLFASEIKAILEVDPEHRELHFEALHHYLSLRFVPAPHTMFRRVFKLPAAHWLVLEAGESRLQRYWQLSFRDKLHRPEEELLEALREKLAGTVSAHLVSDVPVGALLSGGMDSSMIVALMAALTAKPSPTFAIGVEEQSFNELPHARRVANRYGTEHYERIVSADLIGQLPKIIRHLDEPCDPIAACMYSASQLASEHVKVTLGGDGGDELFGGFDRYLGVGWVDFYNRLPALLRLRLVRPLLTRLPESFAYKSWTQKARWLDRLSELPDLAHRYAEATLFFRFNRQQKRLLFTESLRRRVEDPDSAGFLAELFEAEHADEPLDRMLYTDFMSRLPDHSLMLTDRMSMAHGLEVRAPYLDHELVEFLAAFPSRFKVSRHRSKRVLRKLARDYLPAEIVRRRKQGFMFPVASWFRNDLYTFLKRFLPASAVVDAGIFRRGFVEQLIEDHRRRRIDHHVRLWMLLAVEIWFRLYVEQQDPGAVVERIDACRAPTREAGRC